MFTLATADYIAGVASVATQVTCTIFGMELNGTTEVYKVLYQGQLPSSAATIYTAPASNTSFIKTITVVNNDSSARTFQLFRGGTAAANAITPAISLAASGGTATYEDGYGWGEISIAPGSTLLNPVFSGYLDLDGIPNPSAPGTDVLRLWARKISGRMLPKWMGPSGLDTPFQPALFGNNVVFWQPGATSGVLNGSVGTAIAAGVATAPTTTNGYTRMRRSVFTVATGANLQNTYRTDAMFFRGSTAGFGGFFFFCRMGFTTWTAGNRLFVGLGVDTTAMLTADPSSKFNTLGFGVDGADTAITFMHNDGSGTAAKETISGQPALASSNAYDFYIFCKPNDSTVYFRMDNILTGATIIDSSVTTELPVNTTMLIAQCGMGSGANAGAGVAAFGLNRMYIESDY